MDLFFDQKGDLNSPWISILCAARSFHTKFSNVFLSLSHIEMIGNYGHINGIDYVKFQEILFIHCWQNI